jgi:hypothetical protein
VSERPTAHDAATLFPVYDRLLDLPIGPWLVSLRPKLPWTQWIELMTKESMVLKIAELYEGLKEAQIVAHLRRFVVFEDLSNVCDDKTSLPDSNHSRDGDATSITTLERRIEDAPHYVRFWHRLCDAYVNNEAAIGACQRAAIGARKRGTNEQFPSTPSPSLILYNLHAEKGNYSKAIDVFNKIFHGSSGVRYSGSTSYSCQQRQAKIAGE